MLLGDEVFELVDEMPIEIGAMAREGRIDDAFRVMLRDPDGDWDRLRKCRPSYQDITDVIEYYGTALGESVRSIENSTNTGESLNPTSTATTASTLPKPVMAQPASTPDVWPGTSVPYHPTPPTSAS